MELGGKERNSDTLPRREGARTLWDVRGKHGKRLSLLPKEILHLLAQIFWEGDRAVGQDYWEMLWTIAHGGDGRLEKGFLRAG